LSTHNNRLKQLVSSPLLITGMDLSGQEPTPACHQQALETGTAPDVSNNEAACKLRQ
jgi:hypothetical protein